jgi:hypothetical protein
MRLMIPFMVAVAQTSCGSSEACPPTCPAAWVGVAFSVTSSADGGAPSGVQATLSGPATVTMSCQPSPRGDGTSCQWPMATPLTTGSYALQVTAPGFRAANVNATVATVADSCCPGATMQPSGVALDPG